MADIFIGDGSAGKVFVGTSEVSKVFVGNTQVWPSAVSITISGTITDSVNNATIASPLTYSVTGAPGAQVSFQRTITADAGYAHGSYTEDSSIWGISRSGNTLTFTYTIPSGQTSNITNNFTVDGAAAAVTYTANLYVTDTVAGKSNTSLSSDVQDTGNIGDEYSLFYYRTPNADYEWSGTAPAAIEKNGTFSSSSLSFSETYTGTVVATEYSGNVVITSADDNVTVINVSPSTYSDLTYDTAVTVDYDLRANSGYEFEDGQTLITGNSVVLRVPSGGGNLTYEDQTLAELTGYEVTLSVVNNISGPEAGYNIKGATQSRAGSYGQSWSFGIPTVTVNDDYTADVAIVVTPSTAFSGTFGDGTDSVSHTITGTVSATEYSGTVSLTAQENTSISITGGNTFSNLNVGDTHTVTFTITADEGYQFDDGDTEKTGQTIDLTVASGGAVSGTVSGYTLEASEYTVTFSTTNNITGPTDGYTLTNAEQDDQTGTIGDDWSFLLPTATVNDGYEADTALTVTPSTAQSGTFGDGTDSVSHTFAGAVSAEGYSGTVTLNPQENTSVTITAGGSFSGLDIGDSHTVTYTIETDAGYEFSDGTTEKTGQTIELTVDSEGEVSGTVSGFTLNEITFTVTGSVNAVLSGCTIDVDGDTTVPYLYSTTRTASTGNTFDIVLTPNEGEAFVSTDDATVTSANPLTVSSKTLNTDGTITIVMSVPAGTSNVHDIFAVNATTGEELEYTVSGTVTAVLDGCTIDVDGDTTEPYTYSTTRTVSEGSTFDIVLTPDDGKEFTAASDADVTAINPLMESSTTLNSNGTITIVMSLPAGVGSATDHFTVTATASDITYTTTVFLIEPGLNAHEEDVDGGFITSVSTTGVDDYTEDMDIYFDPSFGYEYTSASQVTVTDGNTYTAGTPTLEDDGRVKVPFTFRVDKDDPVENAVYDATASPIEYTYTIDTDHTFTNAELEDADGNVITTLSITAPNNGSNTGDVYVAPDAGYSYSAASDVTTSWNIDASSLSVDGGTLQSDGRIKFVVTLTNPFFDSSLYDLDFSGDPT